MQKQNHVGLKYFPTCFFINQENNFSIGNRIAQIELKRSPAHVVSYTFLMSVSLAQINLCLKPDVYVQLIQHIFGVSIICRCLTPRAIRHINIFSSWFDICLLADQFSKYLFVLVPNSLPFPYKPPVCAPALYKFPNKIFHIYFS